MTASALRSAAERVSRKAGGAGHIVVATCEEGVLFEAGHGEVVFTERWSEGELVLLLDAGGGRVGFASAQIGGDFDPEEVVDRARQSGEVLSPDPARSMDFTPAPPGRARLELTDPSWTGAREGDGAQMALRLERASLTNPLVTSARKPAFEAVKASTLVAVNGAVTATWREHSFALQVEVAAGDGAGAQSGWAAQDARRFSALDPERVGGEAALRAVELLTPREAPNGLFPVLLDRRVAAEALELIGGALCGDSHRKKTSFFLGRLGEKLFPDCVTVIDDGLFRGGPASRPVDDEGTPCGRTVAIDRGTVAALLYDRAEGARAGRPSTGNGFADGGQPTPSTTNLFLKNGSTPLSGLVASISRGLWVREVLGLHTADPVTGEFSVGCTGLWIEKGKVSHPVAGAMLSGDILSLFGRVTGVGDDFAFTGGHGSPSLLVEKIRVSGQ